LSLIAWSKFQSSRPARLLAEGPKIKLDNTELNTAPVAPPSAPGRSVWRTIKSFILWSHERGTIQYDVMVTLILLFVFFSPRVINFNDHPVERNPHPSDIIVSPDGSGGFVYQIQGKAVQSGPGPSGANRSNDDPAVRAQLLRIIEPISGEISIKNYEAVTDQKGNVLSYKVWVQR
jgi:hypothetical protein